MCAQRADALIRHVNVNTAPLAYALPSVLTNTKNNNHNHSTHEHTQALAHALLAVSARVARWMQSSQFVSLLLHPETLRRPLTLPLLWALVQYKHHEDIEEDAEDEATASAAATNTASTANTQNTTKVEDSMNDKDSIAPTLFDRTATVGGRRGSKDLKAARNRAHLRVTSFTTCPDAATPGAKPAAGPGSGPNSRRATPLGQLNTQLLPLAENAAMAADARQTISDTNKTSPAETNFLLMLEKAEESTQGSDTTVSNPHSVECEKDDIKQEPYSNTFNKVELEDSIPPFIRAQSDPEISNQAQVSNTLSHHKGHRKALHARSGSWSAAVGASKDSLFDVSSETQSKTMAASSGSLTPNPAHPSNNALSTTFQKNSRASLPLTTGLPPLGPSITNTTAASVTLSTSAPHTPLGMRRSPLLLRTGPGPVRATALPHKQEIPSSVMASHHVHHEKVHQISSPLKPSIGAPTETPAYAHAVHAFFHSSGSVGAALAKTSPQLLPHFLRGCRYQCEGCLAAGAELLDLLTSALSPSSSTTNPAQAQKLDLLLSSRLLSLLVTPLHQTLQQIQGADSNSSNGLNNNNNGGNPDHESDQLNFMGKVVHNSYLLQTIFALLSHRRVSPFVLRRLLKDLNALLLSSAQTAQVNAQILLKFCNNWQVGLFAALQQLTALKATSQQLQQDMRNNKHRFGSSSSAASSSAITAARLLGLAPKESISQAMCSEFERLQYHPRLLERIYQYILNLYSVLHYTSFATTPFMSFRSTFHSSLSLVLSFTSAQSVNSDVQLIRDLLSTLVQRISHKLRTKTLNLSTAQFDGSHSTSSDASNGSNSLWVSLLYVVDLVKYFIFNLPLPHDIILAVRYGIPLQEFCSATMKLHQLFKRKSRRSSKSHSNSGSHSSGHSGQAHSQNSKTNSRTSKANGAASTTGSKRRGSGRNNVNGTGDASTDNEVRDKDKDENCLDLSGIPIDFSIFANLASSVYEVNLDGASSSSTTNNHNNTHYSSSSSSSTNSQLVNGGATPLLIAQAQAQAQVSANVHWRQGLAADVELLDRTLDLLKLAKCYHEMDASKWSEAKQTDLKNLIIENEKAKAKKDRISEINNPFSKSKLTPGWEDLSSLASSLTGAARSAYEALQCFVALAQDASTFLSLLRVHAHLLNEDQIKALATNFLQTDRREKIFCTKLNLAN